MPEIEFVDPDFDAGADEELDTQPRRPWSSRTKRAVRIGAAAVLAVLAGSAIVGAVQHGGNDRPAASPTVGADPVLAPEAPPSAFRVDHLGADAPEGARPGTLAGQAPASQLPVVVVGCPVVDACDVRRTLPTAVGTALRARLPDVRHITGTTVVVKGPRPTLRARQITAQGGRLSVRIDIRTATLRQLPTTSTSASTLTVGAGSTVVATAIARGFAVTVTVSGPDTAVPGPATVRRLADDPRLLSVA